MYIIKYTKLDTYDIEIRYIFYISLAKCIYKSNRKSILFHILEQKVILSIRIQKNLFKKYILNIKGENMKYILISLLSISFANAQVNTGEAIKANKYNGDTLHVGSIQQSILTEAEFQALAGNCWVLMAGQTLSGTDLGTITLARDGSGTGNTNDDGLSAMANLPDASGRFLRSSGGNSTSLGQAQDDAIKSHAHRWENSFDSQQLSASSQSTGYFAPWFNGNGLHLDGPTYKDPDATIGTLSDETRPINITVNTFVKINKECQ